MPKTQPINAPCIRTHTATRSSGTRPMSEVKWIVLHDTESERDTFGDTAEAVARYFASPSAKGSTHLVVDNHACYRCAANDVVVWGATHANYSGWHIEHAGRASWSKTVWRVKNVTMLRRSAYRAAKFSIRNGIPARLVTVQGLRAGEKGITTHALVEQAWPSTGHTDPGAGFPIRFYIMLVRHYRRKLKKR